LTAKRILILGAGFGGLAAANKLRKSLSQDHRIIVIDRKKSFMMGLVNLWILAGSRGLEDSQTPIDGLNSRGIEYLNDEAVKIDPDSSRVQTAAHGWITYDYLVIALGSELAPERINGFVGRGFNLYDSSQVPALREKLLAIKRGRVAISIMGLPYKCPPAPYEAAMIINDILTKNGTRGTIDIDMYVPSPLSLPIAGPKVSADVVATIEKYGIKFNPSCKISSVRDGEIEFEGGRKETYDVLVGIPPHRSPDVIKSSGLTTREWISVNRQTMRTDRKNIFAVGDVTEIKVGQSAIPKAGIFAEGQAKAAAGQIINEINNDKSEASFDGQGFCFMEIGGRQAGYVKADFYNPDGPLLSLEPPSEANYEKKHDFERSRIREWLL